MLACNSNNPSWNLPIRLGESKSKVYSILGAPDQDNKIDIQWFQKSGFTIKYDPDGNVSTIIIHGPWNKSKFFTYTNPVLSDLKVTDAIEKFKIRLGTPTRIEQPITNDPSLGKYIWQFSTYRIEVEYWIRDHIENDIPVKANEIASVVIIRAIGGK